MSVPTGSGPAEAAVIRAAGPEDAEAIARVRVRSWRSAYRGLLPAGLIETATRDADGAGVRAFLDGNRGRRALLAEDDGSPVGMAMYGPGRPSNPAAELYVIYVIQEYWSTGVGRALMDRVLGGVRAGGYSSIFLWVLSGNTRARRFYERYGFTVTGHQAIHLYGHAVHETRYERAA